MTTLVQVGCHRGFALKIDPQDSRPTPEVTAVNILTGETLGSAIGQVEASELIEAHLAAGQR